MKLVNQVSISLFIFVFKKQPTCERGGHPCFTVATLSAPLPSSDGHDSHLETSSRRVVITFRQD